VTKATRPGPLPPPSGKGSEGRVCSYPGCETKLSVYNLSDLCWQHDDVVFSNPRGKRRDRDPS
jgi:hypothetical protein